jgi:hypothetical protein
MEGEMAAATAFKLWRACHPRGFRQAESITSRDSQRGRDLRTSIIMNKARLVPR